MIGKNVYNQSFINLSKFFLDLILSMTTVESINNPPQKVFHVGTSFKKK